MDVVALGRESRGLSWPSSVSRRGMEPSQEVCSRWTGSGQIEGQELPQGYHLWGKPTEQSRKVRSPTFSRYLSCSVFVPGIKYRHTEK